MNWTCKLLAVALAAVALFCLDVYAQSTLDSILNKGSRADEAGSFRKQGSLRRGDKGGCPAGLQSRMMSPKLIKFTQRLFLNFPLIQKPKRGSLVSTLCQTVDRWTIRHADYGSKQKVRTLLWMTTTR